jgi:alpha-tubulin suppressor-like RCC1 family protein
VITSDIHRSKTRRYDTLVFGRPLTVVLLALSCDKTPTDLVPNPPAAMIIVSGNEQPGTVGTELAAPVVVRVTDAAGLPVKGQIVNFRIVSGGGSVFAGASLTNDAGEARERWTLGTVAAENQRLEARAVDPATGAALVFATFQATASAGPAAKLEKAGGDNGQASVSTAVTPSPSVKVVDQYNNPVGGTAVVFAVASGGGSVAGPTQTTNASGVAAVGSWTLGSTPGANTLTATATGLTGSPATFTATGTSVPLVLARLFVGGAHTCGLTSSGSAHCWGNNAMGGLGDGTTDMRLKPVPVLSELVFTTVSPGGGHTCGLTSAGAAYCWGRNEYGQVGDGTMTNRVTPVAVMGGLVFAKLSAGGIHTCGLTSTGAAYCWGDNRFGGLGDGTTTSRTAPVAVQGGLTFASLSPGASQHTCGLTSAGTAYCWGWNLYGSVGDGTNVDRVTPVAVQGGHSFTTLSAGVPNCALTSTGAAYCWGFNDSGQLGDGTTTSRSTPVAVQGGIVFAGISAGNDQVCGLTSGGDAYCWGDNPHGQLGDGTTTGRLTPVAVQGGHKFTAVGAGHSHACGLTNAGAAYCWGHNRYGALGDGTVIDRHTPVAVAAP